MFGYTIILQLANSESNATVYVTSRSGTQQHGFQDYRFIGVAEPSPVYIESRNPLMVIVYPFNESLSYLPFTAVCIPSITQYRNSYVVSNTNGVIPGHFDESVTIVLPTSKRDGILVDGTPLSSSETTTTLSVYTTSYSFVSIPMYSSYHVITHTDPSVKFGAFVFGKGQLHGNIYPQYGFPAGIQ